MKNGKQSNLVNGLTLLENSKVPFEIKNNGLHIVIDCSIDYWPTTGKFIRRSDKYQGKGIYNLLKIIHRERDERL